MIQKERVKSLNKAELKKGKYVLYWMQASQRETCNHALEYAIRKANALCQPVVVFFGIVDDFPEANERHYFFMLEGLCDAKRTLEKRGIQLVIQHCSPELGVVMMSRDASLVVVDRGYLRIQKAWRNVAAASMDCPLIQVESDVVVPIEETSSKEEYSAATIRKKIHQKLNQYLISLEETKPMADSLSLDFESFPIDDVERAILRLDIDRSVKCVSFFRGGFEEGRKHLDVFIDQKLEHYAEHRNDPTLDCLSLMSPYLHFGQISPLYIALRILNSGRTSSEAYLEELIVRRELGINFVFYNTHYDTFECLPGWAKKSLRTHEKDQRPYHYSRKELEDGKTHDPYWNAAQKEMVLKGKMHGYMRMYWGKKIIEWCETPEEAFHTAIYLNNKYELDGREPNGFMGVAWCFGKHDRPWRERNIFGNVRYMNDRGLKRKFDADGYVKLSAQWEDQGALIPNQLE
ncbi:deoxyribodipyrimidine photo-lyase [Syntrophus aciditrophicus]|uniref:Deoxyribodipyrimidine photo-lyase n=1 Tax=Syntrophus aciditrophicus (strain SB) TaxID=56780 RepID=Q2LS17_SYNAS|nr:deoxyribodipyrimidine photo-lyase [Syntrophus aciditrophicus]ABC76875.1 deoxyribodipyrimidine photolyase [Syntrophus aciditrophicus SB]OPY14136.1 MAG: deoxyribodipyrimidine photolyase [Syntrophus sp. PtaB.Bin075]